MEPSVVLDALVQTGELKSYEHAEVQDSGHPGTRDRERLTLYFPSGKKLILETFCSGFSENTCLIIEE